MKQSVFTTARAGALVAALVVGSAAAVQAQGILPGDDVVRPWGEGVTPVYEGWYENPTGDGIYISFGYLNRNSEEVVNIPHGPSNRLSSEAVDGIQPTHFEPWREYGVFTIHVPDDFGRNEIVWTLERNGEEWAIPGRVSNINYQIDAMMAPGSGLTPPAVRFDRNGEEGRGPHGIRTDAGTVAVGEPLELEVWTEDDTWVLSEGQAEAHSVNLYYFPFSGPGEVEFDQNRIQVSPASELAEAVNTATFSEPGEYVLLVRAFNEPVGSAGMEQCCWTNGYVGVTVTP